jgi:hypothetical protein
MPAKRTSVALLGALALLAPTFAAPGPAAAQPKAAPGVTYAMNAAAAPVKRPDPQRYADRVEAYVTQDRQAPPDPCSILFIGSASVVGWKTLKADMAPAPVFARGLGASTIADQAFWFDKIVAPYRPRAIFMYATENDVVNGLTPAEVLEDMKTFMDLKTKVLGATPVYFLAAKPSPARLAFAADQQKANDLVERLAAQRPDLVYIDVAHVMWEGGKSLGQLRPLYIADGIHLTPEGFEIWTRIVKPHVLKEAARTNACPAAPG